MPSPDNIVAMQLGYRLSAARRKLELTQMELSKKTGIIQGDISKIEKGQGNPSLKTLLRLADALGVTLDINLVQKDNKKPKRIH